MWGFGGIFSIVLWSISGSSDVSVLSGRVGLWEHFRTLEMVSLGLNSTGGLYEASVFYGLDWGLYGHCGATRRV